MGDADIAVFFTDDFAEIDVLDWIVRFRHSPGTARAVDLGLFHGSDHFLALSDIAFNRVDSGGEQ